MKHGFLWNFQYMSMLYKGLNPIRVSVLCVKMAKD